jgi:hypothetical protein
MPSDARFHELLLNFDRDLADAARCARSAGGVPPFRPLLALATRPCLPFILQIPGLFVAA